jgi:hypothetical protein
MYTGRHVKCPFFLSGINEISIFVGTFFKNTQISFLMKIRPVGGEMFHAGGWTDGHTDMTKLTVAFRNFANAPNNVLPTGCIYVSCVHCAARTNSLTTIQVNRRL